MGVFGRSFADGLGYKEDEDTLMINGREDRIMKIPLLCSTCCHRVIMKRGRDVDYNAPPKSRETVIRCRSIGTPHKVKKDGNCLWYERDRIPEQEILE